MIKLGMMKILTCHTQRCTQILKYFRLRSDQLFQRSHKALKMGLLSSFNLKFMKLNKSSLDFGEGAKYSCFVYKVSTVLYIHVMLHKSLLILLRILRSLLTFLVAFIS